MPTNDPEGPIFLTASYNYDGFFFLHTSIYFNVESPLRSHVDVWHIESWRRMCIPMTTTSNVLTTQLRDLLYDQFIDNTLLFRG